MERKVDQDTIVKDHKEIVFTLWESETRMKKYFMTRSDNNKTYFIPGGKTFARVRFINYVVAVENSNQQMMDACKVREV